MSIPKSRYLPFFLAGLALLPLLAAPAFCQEAEVKELDTADKPEPSTPAELDLLKKIEEAKRDLGKVRDKLLGPVKVNGKVIPTQAIRRQTIYQAGANVMELKILEFIVEEWKQRSIKEGKRKPEDFEVDDAVIEKELRKNLKEFTIKYPGLDFWEVVRAQTGIAKERYIHQRRVTMVFDKVFFPGAPDQWPEITQQAIKAGSGGNDGQDFFDGLVKNGRDEKGNPRKMPPFWLEMIRKMLINKLKEWSDIKYAADDLPAEFAVDVNGLRWRTDEAFEQVKAGLFVQDMEKALTEVVICEALKQELAKNDAYLSDKKFRDLFVKYREQYDNTLFTTEMIARAFKGYPTMEAFRSRWRLMRSFEDLIAKQINDDNLQKHADEHKRFFSDGSVNVDVIRFLGKDQRTSAWAPDGMDKAKERAQAVMKLINEGKLTFDQGLDQKGEYYMNDKERGRIGSKSLNELRRTLGESEYTDLLQGYSMAYYIYYNAEVGKAVGPIRGPDSHYILRVNARTPARSDVAVSDPRTRELVKQDFLTHRFLVWANEVMARTKIE